MLQKIKDYLYLDGNHEDAILNTFIAASRAYIEASLRNTSNIEKVRQDERYELLTLMLTAHFYNNRGVSIETATHTIPHGVYPLMRQLDTVKGEAPTPPVEPTVKYVKINGADYEYVSRTATSITLAETETVPSIVSPFINIDGIDYAYNGSQGRVVSFFELSEFSIINKDETLHGSFKGYSRMPQLYLKTFEDLTGKLVELFGTTYELIQQSVYTFDLEKYIPAPVEPVYDDEVDVYSTTTSSRIGTFDADTSNLPTLIIKDRVLSADEYYMSAWGTFPGIMIMDTATTVKPYVSPTFDFNTDYKIVDDTTMYKRGTNQSAHSFIFEDFEYTLSNPRNYIDHTIFDYVAVPYEAPVEPDFGTIMNYEVYMDYQKATVVANRGYQLAGTGSALFDANELTLTQPTFIEGLERFVVEYYEPSSPRLVRDTDNDTWYEANVQPHGVVQLTATTAPTLGTGTNYKPRISMVNSSLQVIDVSTANARNYQFSGNTGLTTLGFTPNRVPARLRSPDHTSTSAVLRYLTPVNGVQTELIHHASTIDMYAKMLDTNNRVIGCIPLAVVEDNSATLYEGYWADYRAVKVDVPNQGIKNIVSYDPLTGVLVWE